MMARRWIACIVALLAAPLAAAQSDPSWDIVINGRAVHMNASRKWNEENWGLGLEREFASDGPWVKLAVANAFKDSMGDPSYMAGGGIKRRFAPTRDSSFYIDVGAVGFLMTREKVNHNRAFPGVLPAATFGFKRLAVNLTYMPSAAVDFVTNARQTDPTLDSVFFLQLKLDSSLFGFGRPKRQFLASDNATTLAR